MKNKIKKFAKGSFDFERPDIIFPETNIMIMIGEGEIYKGSFRIESRTEEVIRGLIYPSSFRVHLAEEGFEGNPVLVQFTYDGTDLEPGYVEQGNFTIVCNGGEYELGYTVVVEKPYIMTDFGKIQNMKNFRNLALEDYEEAHRLFRSRDFYEILKYEEKRNYNLYDNMRKWSLSEQAMEEFLVGTKQKERIYLMLSEDEKYFSDLTEPIKETITITKNTWGFMPIRVETDGKFLCAEQTELSTDNFIGMFYTFEYKIDDRELHTGHNFGRIIFVTPYERLVYNVDVYQPPMQKQILESTFVQAQIIKELLSSESGQKAKNLWATETIARLRQLHEKFPKDGRYQLLQAQIYLSMGEDEDAKWILEHYEYRPHDPGRSLETNAYYLFLTACVKKEGKHTERVMEELKKLYAKCPKSWKLLSMITHLDPKYKNVSEKLRVMEQQFFYDTNATLFYLDAFRTYEQKWDAMKKLGPFEIQILNFAAKYRLISKEFALYVAEIILQQKAYSAHLVRAMISLYKIYDETMILAAICTQLIKGNKCMPQYFKWYERAVENELKISQLYEYYMLSVSERKMQRVLPRTIYLYFMYGSTLPYQREAMLYANLITFEEEGSDLYANYKERIEAFAWEQLEKRHITPALRVIYRRFIQEEKMTPGRMEALRDICSTYEIKTKVPDMKWVMVIEKDGVIRQHVPYDLDSTKILLRGKDARIVWESKDGRYYTDTVPYETRRMFYEPYFLELCKNYKETVEVPKLSQDQTELTLESIRRKGMKAFKEQDILRFCSRKVRDDNYEEDETLTHLCFMLYVRGQYDKVILNYLAEYYCGATKNMKRIYYTAKDYEISTKKLSERIITQMLFAEELIGEERIFEDYYMGTPYFRLKQAYLAYVSREYMIKDRKVDACIFEIILNEYRNRETLADICKLALLKYYSEQEYDEETGVLLKRYLYEMREKNLLFSFYMKYEESWLREMQLYDKTLVEYHASGNGKVRITYQLNQSEAEGMDYQSEVLTPMYENIYVKEFVLYANETLYYQFRETFGDMEMPTDRKSCEAKSPKAWIGRYGRINRMLEHSGAERREMMFEYLKEDKAAKEIFQLYEG